MDKEILQQYKEGKFSPLEIEVACANAFSSNPRQPAEWYGKLFEAQKAAICLYISSDTHDDWPQKAEECLNKTVIDLHPPVMNLSASAKSLDMAMLYYADWLASITRPEDLIVLGWGIPRAIATRLVPQLEDRDRKCAELVVSNSKDFVCFRRL